MANTKLENEDKKVISIDTHQLKFILQSTFYAARNATLTSKKPGSVLFWGAGGIGKTAIIQQEAKKVDLVPEDGSFIVLDLQTMSSEDFFLPAAKGGVGKDYTIDTKAVRLPMENLPLYDIREGKTGDDRVNGGPDGKGGTIFIDEIACCDERVQDVLLQLCSHTRRIGNYQLGSRWSIIAAANRSGDRTEDESTYKFNPILGDRFSHYNFHPKFVEWIIWANETDENGEPHVDHRIVVFLRFFEEHWHNFDDWVDNQGRKSVINSTPRSWERASDDIKNHSATRAHFQEKYTIDDMYLSVSGAVGTAAASDFISFAEILEKYPATSLEKVYTDPKNAPSTTAFNGKISQQAGLIAAIISFKSSSKLTNLEIENFSKWVIGMKDERLAIRAWSEFKSVHSYLKYENCDKTTSDFICTIEENLYDNYPNLVEKQTVTLIK